MHETHEVRDLFEDVVWMSAALQCHHVSWNIFFLLWEQNWLATGFTRTCRHEHVTKDRQTFDLQCTFMFAFGSQDSFIKLFLSCPWAPTPLRQSVSFHFLSLAETCTFHYPENKDEIWHKWHVLNLAARDYKPSHTLLWIMGRKLTQKNWINI